MSGMASGLDTENIVKELMSAQRLKTDKINKNITKMEWKRDKWKELNTKIYALYTGELSKIRMQGNFNIKKATSSNEDKVEVKASNSVPEGAHTVQVLSTASAQFITGSQIDQENLSYSTKLVDMDMSDSVGSTINIKAGKNEVALEIKAETTIGDVVSSLQNAGLNASFDVTQKRFFISSKQGGIENAFSIESADPGNPVELQKLGLSEISKSVDTENGTAEITVAANVSVIDPSDAVIIYNGARIRSSSNTITANGLSITVKGVTDESTDEVISVGITRDTQAVYDMVKGFVKSYNEVLKEMNGAYNTEAAKGYEPLTDEEREAMTDDQVEKWEKRIKDSLLRRDNTLGSLMNTMRTTLSKGVEVDGKKYSLASFGITSVDYKEEGLLHINGDKDDALVASGEEKLMKAISENPDAVMKVFSSLASELYGTLTEEMKSTSLNSALTLYNDKEINNKITDYKEDLSKLEGRLQAMESRYYKQFTAMESMMSKLNTQSSSIASILGMNTNS
jgi:flagellar hook-associated protein 2